MNTAAPHPLAAALAEGAAALGLMLPADVQARLLAHLDLIARWSRVVNLTAVREPTRMLTQHLLDCLAVLAPLRRHAAANSLAAPRILDVGSGAGLPGVVLAIAEPAWRLTCIDAVAKKASFIRQAAGELGLANLRTVHGRVETLAGAQRFDIIISRAFSSLREFTALTEASLAPGGVWVAMKGKPPEDECAVLPAGVQMFHVEPLCVPGLNAERCLAWLRANPVH